MYTSHYPLPSWRLWKNCENCSMELFCPELVDIDVESQKSLNVEQDSCMWTTGVKVCIGVIAIELLRITLALFQNFESRCASKTFLPEERFLCACIELCKNVQRCLWNQFVLRNLANSAVGQTRIGLWSYSMNKAEWEEL